MTEFVALRAKMYAYRRIDKEVEEKHCKGTQNCVVSEGLTFDDYKTYLFNGEMIYREQHCLRIRSMRCARLTNKITLNRNDDKRLVQADGITILAREYTVISV